MNVHFNVLAIIPLGPLDYDIGAGSPTLQAQYPDIKPNKGTLDFLHDQTKITGEEAALYAGHVNNPSMANLYFLPDDLKGHGPSPSIQAPYAGYARLNSRVALIAGRPWSLNNPQYKADTRTQLLETAAHEIGHLGMGEGGENAPQCLYHPRPRGKLNPSNLLGFPLRRESDDLKRLMWAGDPMDSRPKPSRTGALLIKDEWTQFRNSKP
jgi:hypothetical protein